MNRTEMMRCKTDILQRTIDHCLRNQAKFDFYSFFPHRTKMRKEIQWGFF
jgi:hypothetical protein